MTSQSSQMGETRPIVFKLFKVKVEILKVLSSLSKIIRDRSVLRYHQSSLKTLVHNLIFKTSSFMLGHLYKTLFEHLLQLFNYACSLIYILQKLTLDLDQCVCHLSSKGYF